MTGATNGDAGRSREREAQALEQALSHPLKAQILTVLGERPGSTIREVAERLRESERRVRHQMEKLADANLIEVSAERSRRGVIVRRYANRLPTLFTGTDEKARLNYALTVVKLLLADVMVAAAERTFADPHDFVVRDFGEVDDACVEEVIAIYERAFPEVEKAMKAGRERFRKSGGKRTQLVIGLLLFKAPLWGHQDSEP
jgi:DNA-binding transcriptional ArsR family regulator